MLEQSKFIRNCHHYHVMFGARMQFLAVFGAYLENNVYLCSRFGDDGVFHSGIKGNQVKVLSSTRYCHPLVKSPNITTDESWEGGLFGESQETCQDDVTDAHTCLGNKAR